MKKILLLLTIISLLIACSGNRQVRQGDVYSVEDVNAFVKELINNQTTAFSVEQWKVLEKEYYNILDKANHAGQELTTKELELLAEMKETFEQKKNRDKQELAERQKGAEKKLEEITKKVKKDVKDKVEDAADAVEIGAKEVKRQKTADAKKAAKLKEKSKK